MKTIKNLQTKPLILSIIDILAIIMNFIGAYINFINNKFIIMSLQLLIIIVVSISLIAYLYYCKVTNTLWKK